MSAPVVPYARVVAPARGAPVRYGLFSAATVLEGVTGHELGGIDYEAVCSTKVDPYPAACVAPTPERKTAANTTSTVRAAPFAVYAADECMLGRDQATAIGQLRTRLLSGEQTTVERVISDGKFGESGKFTTYPALKDGPELLLNGAEAKDLNEAIGLLEQWLAESYGGAGVIHAPRWFAPVLAKQAALTLSGPRATTAMGNVVAFGTGYDGKAPVGQTGDKVWLYATPPVTVRRSPIIEPADWSSGAFDKAQNAGFLLAERVYVVDWPCGTAAIETSFLPTAAKAGEPAETSRRKKTTSTITEEDA